MENTNLTEWMTIDDKVYEAFRMLRINLERAYKEIKVITLIGATKDVGTSFTAFYTAKSFAASGKKCIYINTCMNKKDKNTIYDLQGNNKSLWDYLTGSCSIKDIINDTGILNFAVIDSGNSTDSVNELLTSKKYAELLKAMKAEFDYVIIDTPALKESSDAAISASISDGVIIVLEKGYIPYEEVRKVKRTLELSSCKILGVVLNK